MEEKVKKYFNGYTIGNILTIAIGVLLYLGISNFSVVQSAVSRVINVLSPFIYAFALAYILNNPIKWFEQNVFYKKKYKKALSIVVVYLIFITALCALFFAIAPQLLESIISITDAVPEYLRSLSGVATQWMEAYHIDAELATELEKVLVSIVQGVSGFIMGLVPELLNLSISVGNIVVKTLVSLIASIYMLIGKERLIFQIKKLTFAYFPMDKADQLVDISRRSNRIFSGFITGKIIDSTIIGIICFICMLFIYRPFALLIAVVIGVTNMIPFFGPFIGAIPCTFILFMIKPSIAFVFVIFIIILQQIDGNIIGPKILGDSTGLSAIWVLIAIVVGNGLFGFIGMLIGVPTFAVLYSLVSENIKHRLESKGLTADYSENDLTFHQIGFEDETK